MQTLISKIACVTTEYMYKHTSSTVVEMARGEKFAPRS